jgi:hypothetical protein
MSPAIGPAGATDRGVVGARDIARHIPAPVTNHGQEVERRGSRANVPVEQLDRMPEADRSAGPIR